MHMWRMAVAAAQLFLEAPNLRARRKAT